MSVSDKGLSVEVYNSVGGTAFFERLLDEWKNNGVRVISYHAITESRYRESRGRLGRISLRCQMYPGYAWACWRGALKGRAQCPTRVVTTNPFFAPSLVAHTARGRGPTINLMYDLFPEALMQAGTISGDSMVARRCAAVTRYALRSCAATVFLGDRLRAYAEKTHGSARRAVVIPVGADGHPFVSTMPQLLAAEAEPQVLYSGQMGRMHDVETLIGLWKEDKFRGVTWAFHASGAGYTRLYKTVGVTRGVTWSGPLPETAWKVTMKEAQVALVTIAPGAERVVLPSKSYSAMVAGQAILAICPRQSDLADLVLKHDCGWVVAPGDVAGLARAVASIAQGRHELWRKRRNAFEAGHQYYDMKPIARKWLKLFEEVDERDSPFHLPKQTLTEHL